MKLTAENYHSREANNAYWSASLIKEFMDCPARAVAELRGEYERPKTVALLVGGYVDAWFEGPEAFERFVEENRDEILQKNGKPRANFITAREMIDRAESDPVFMEHMEGEKQVIMTGEICGMPFKVKFDVLHPKRTVDLKTVKDLEPVYLPGQGRVSFADAWHWPMQMSTYQEIRAQNDGYQLPTFLDVITKQSPPDLALVALEQETLDVEMAVLTDKLPLYDAYKQGVIEPPRCGRCAYCRASKKLSGPTPLTYYQFGGTDE